ncbi:hypothetical protein UFOVP254_34 [uncultured Caudovirales phage]|uniref:Uncharacterized protein n=1 Tax=uncultured Caudovirales phage TaxID=2100421 RepID=A0A6J5LFR8_9CAUD|nr:hypothetical protein UFOVP76_19 [uncultured Caudovirales phage]CAB4133041.1 hypothetical protein UFOVP254_34 [uncultured Caudovirales phage]
MALPNGAGGYQLGDGNLNEVLLETQGAPAAYTAAAAPLAVADISSTGLITYNAAGGNNLQLPTVANLELTVSAAKNNSSFDFYVIALGAGTGTITTNTGWTLVGSMAVATTVSGHFRARKTGDGTWTLYRIS